MLLPPNIYAFTTAPLSPLLSPLGEDRLATDCLSLKLTIRNQRKAPPGRGWGGLLPLGDKRGLRGWGGLFALI